MGNTLLKKASLALALATAFVTPGLADYKMPSWLKDHIHVMQPAYVARYLYKKQTAYVIAYPCCEDGSPVYDANGTRICVLGTWDWNVAAGCPKFLDLAKDEQIVWGEK